MIEMIESSMSSIIEYYEERITSNELIHFSWIIGLWDSWELLDMGKMFLLLSQYNLLSTSQIELDVQYLLFY